MTGALNWLALRHPVFHRFFDPGLVAVKDWRVDSTWTDTVHANLVLGEFEGRRAREIDHPGLGRAVGMQFRKASDTGYRSGRDNRTATRLTQLGHGVFDSQEYRAQQHRNALIPIFDAYLFQWPKRADDAGVVVDDIETTEFFDRPRDQRLDLGFA